MKLIFSLIISLLFISCSDNNNKNTTELTINNTKFNYSITLNNNWQLQKSEEYKFLDLDSVNLDNVKFVSTIDSLKLEVNTKELDDMKKFPQFNPSTMALVIESMTTSEIQTLNQPDTIHIINGRSILIKCYQSSQYGDTSYFTAAYFIEKKNIFVLYLFAEILKNKSCHLDKMKEFIKLINFKN